MAHHFQWHCNKCDFHFDAFGPQECIISHYKDQTIIKPLPHPLADIASGLFVHGFCKTCGKEVDVIVIEFIKPDEPWEIKKENIRPEYLANYSNFIKDHPDKDTVFTECYNYAALICPTCKSNIVVYPVISKPFPCPSCEMGIVEMTHEFIT